VNDFGVGLTTTEYFLNSDVVHIEFDWIGWHSVNCGVGDELTQKVFKSELL
jgi:hypothetical protein